MSGLCGLGWVGLVLCFVGLGDGWVCVLGSDSQGEGGMFPAKQGIDGPRVGLRGRLSLAHFRGEGRGERTERKESK